MQTKIRISGQNNGNFTLHSAIVNSNCEVKTFFNDFILVFASKKEAFNALSKGYQKLRIEEPTEVGKISGINYRRASFLSYDASQAVIEN
jgi:hypothetical protein